MNAAKQSPMVVAAAREICRTQSEACAIDNEDNWKIYGHIYLADAEKVLTACGALDLLQAAKAVAFSNGFDAALPDKMEALRIAVRKATGGAA